MPTTMMYPTQSSSIMRPKPINKSAPVGTHPQWMRTLEDKYQKLHKKITENTTMMNLKFSHSRSFHDFRGLNASRHRDSKLYVKTNNNRSHTQVNSAAPNNNETFVEENTELDQNGNCLQKSESNSNIIKTEQTRNSESENEPTDTGNENQVGLGRVDKQSSGSGSVYDYKSENGEINIKSGLDNKTRVVINSPCGEDTKIIHYAREEEDENFNDIRSGRDLKTALSRTSRKTAKSCPGQIQARSNIRQRPRTQSSVLRSKSAHKNSDMFNRMSKEAHHAITETVKEMNASRSQTCLASDFVPQNITVQFNPSRQRKSVKTWVQPKSDSNKYSAGYNASRVLQGASDKMQELIDCNTDLIHKTRSETNSSANQSCRLSHSSENDAARKSSSKLPEIQNDISKDKFTSKGQLFRLPGIGKYDVPVLDDNLFEITPPGFDSRYKDLATVEERESETPPPDIRQLAIEKCSEWLTKYSNR